MLLLAPLCPYNKSKTVAMVYKARHDQAPPTSTTSFQPFLPTPMSSLQWSSTHTVHSPQFFHAHFTWCYGLNCVPPQNSYVEVLTPVPQHGTILGARAFKELIKFK